MKKRIISTLAALCLLAAVLAVPAGASESGGACGETVTWDLSEDGTLTISGTGDMADFPWEEQPWHSQQDQITSVVIEDGVTGIGSAAFSNAPIASVQIPDSVTSIAYSAFYGCDDLADVTLPAQLKSIGESAFGSCDSLEEITFQGSAPDIGTGSFQDVTAVAYYPGRDTTWTPEAKQQYDGTITWRPWYFVDVVRYSYYEIPVIWAVELGVTNGVDDTHFAPDNTCTREQVVTFLWRAMGSPEPTTTTHPFVDVRADSYYEKAVLWAVENGITIGMDETHFNPGGECTRAQVAMFLWRTLDKPAVNSSQNPFKDVSADQWFYEPVLWAVDAGVTNGITPDRFAPDATCTRAQIVTFLYRALG